MRIRCSTPRCLGGETKPYRTYDFAVHTSVAVCRLPSTIYSLRRYLKAYYLLLHYQSTNTASTYYLWLPRLDTCNRLLTTTRLQLPMCHALLFALAPPLRRTQNCDREAVSISRTRAMSLRVPILPVHWECSFTMLIACRCSNT